MTFCSGGNFLLRKEKYILKRKFKQKFEKKNLGHNLCQGNSGVIPFSVVMVSRGGGVRKAHKIKV